MKHIILKKYENIYLGQKKKDNSNYGMEILADWFTDDVRSHSQGWARWVNDNSEEAEDTECNATWLEKYGNEIVFGSITDLIQAKGVYKPDYDKDTISVPKENVIELLNTWEQLLKTRPKEIMITEENGVFKMFEVQ